MAIARHGTGPRAAVGAVASQVHPVFMAPPLAASGFGAVLGGFPHPRLALLHLAVAFCALYTAHVKDGLVDFHHRGEDDDHPLTRRGCHLALAGSTTLFFAGCVALSLLVDPVAALLALPGWLVAVLHAPQLDTNPFGATLGYPTGIGFALLGGYYVQTRTLSTTVLAFAVVFVVVLAGIKVVDDATDYDYDRSVDKRTVAVVLGRPAARRLAAGLMGAGMVAVVALAVTAVVPRGSALAVVPFLAVAVVARRADAELATMLLVRASYLFFALLVVAVWLRPLAGVTLPDITALGPYTYLATEVLWGAVAITLVVRADAVRAAARTTAVLYPFAYVWDWYTLSVGVFSIPMRTGIDLLGIPIEEHLFMLVVPTMVVGVHETLRDLDD
ncbi:lycopene cyclase domain-containing protein [Haloplanus aerogenes]|uniref:Lycopene cyclase domain-containing protein n=1 Tax=Haloplanus aerogenes TaxID=660522 RepID=A0A3M0CUW1_9EURY|nr:lycopene cyclase domain-containing protein [Haloplanus aerogenes]AZH26605.1 lycopene cyclase domain-containing protein [Haloplanus aerogenes]RMB12837.1 lycopene cyclase domain-containing protein [Haloplanus aerogenes]